MAGLSAFKLCEKTGVAPDRHSNPGRPEPVGRVSIPDITSDIYILSRKRSYVLYCTACGGFDEQHEPKQHLHIQGSQYHQGRSDCWICSLLSAGATVAFSRRTPTIGDENHGGTVMWERSSGAGK